MSKSITVPFHGKTLYVIDNNGQPVVPMKPVVEGMGLDWGTQFRKLQADRFASCIATITMQMPGDAQRRATVCLLLRKLPGWLMTIQPNKIKDQAVRASVIQYQNECDDVLWQYWNEGVAVNHRRLTGLTPAQQRHVQNRVADLVKHPGNNYARLYSGIKDRFGVGTYKDVPSERYPELCRFLGCEPLEGEWVPKQADPNYPVVEVSRNHLYILCRHAQYIRKVWHEELEPALRRMRSPLAAELHDHVKTAAVMATCFQRQLHIAFAEEEREQQARRAMVDQRFLA